MRIVLSAVSIGMRILCPALAGLILILVDGDARAQSSESPQRSDIRVTIGTMLLGDQPMVAKAHTEKPSPSARSTWRHTFGSERKTKEVIVRLPKAGFAADLVALQGVTGPSQARQAFPADQYHLVFSRQLLRPAAQGSEPAEQNHAPATTAIAVARRPEVRVVGQEHLMQMARAPGGGQMTLSAGTALQVLVGTRTIWVLSVDLAQGCAEPTPETSSSAACQAWEMQIAEVARFITARQEAGEAAIVAGVFHRSLERNDLPKTLADLKRTQIKKADATGCTKPAQDPATTYLLLESPADVSPANPRAGPWTFAGDGRVPPESPCTLLVDLAAR